MLQSKWSCFLYSDIYLCHLKRNEGLYSGDKTEENPHCKMEANKSNTQSDRWEVI